MRLRSIGAISALLLAALLAVALTMSSGAFARDKPIKIKPGTGLAFGEFDLSDSDVRVDHVNIMRIKPHKIYVFGFGRKPWEGGTVTYDNGRFFTPNLGPGTYAVIGFISRGRYFSLQDAYRENTFQVEPGRLAYAGSYKLRVRKGGFLRKVKGDFGRVDNAAAQTRLLGWLAVVLAGSDWAPIANARLSPPGPTN